MTDFILYVALPVLSLYVSFHIRKDYTRLISRLYTPIVTLLDQAKFGFGGSGRFTGLIEEWGMEYKSGDIFLGRSLYSPFLKLGMTDDRHMLTIAGSRGGKGVSAIIPNLLLWEGSAVVIDPKGANAAVTARARRSMGHNVYVIDPFGITEFGSARFEPLSRLDPASPIIREQINVIADALTVRNPSAKDPHWDDGARTILAGLIGHLITSPDFTSEQRILPTLRDMISMPTKEKIDMWAAMSMNDGAGRLPIDAANRVLAGSGTSEIQNILSNADKHTEWLSSTVMRDALKEPNFQFSDLKEKPTTVYLVIPVQYLETHNRFVRLFINVLIREFVDKGRSDIPTLLMMDEFLSLGPMPEVENAMSWAAGYNLFLWPFVQDFGNMKALYGEKVNAFITNSRAVQVFACDDDATNTFISERLGERPLQSKLDVRRANEVLPLRKVSEVGRDTEASTGRQYILRTGKPTMLIERVPYFKSDFFKGKYSVDPDYKNAEILEWWQRQM